MVTRTFFNKSNTIFKNSTDNYGLNPISMLNYGNIVSRIILHFDLNKIDECLNNYYGDEENVTHILKMTNCGNIDYKNLGNTIPSSDYNGEKERACSFTIIAVALPEGEDYEWDERIGFDDSTDFWLVGRSSCSSEGSNWYNSKSALEWIKTTSGEIGEGVYDKIFLINEYERYKTCKQRGEKYDGIIIGEQKFDHGNEDLEIDITRYIDTTTSNNGIMLMFAPDYEEMDKTMTQYVGFFNEKTNTFFKPCVETRINDSIQDNRFDFSHKCNNRLYFYYTDGEKFINLDKEPTCMIGDIVYTSRQQFTGCYYITVDKNDLLSFGENEIAIDSWEIDIDGTNHVIEQDFVIYKDKHTFTPTIIKNSVYEPALSGIKDDETLTIGNKNIVEIKFRKPYSSEFKTMNKCYYRIYSKDGNREITIIDWDCIENVGTHNYFIIDSEILSPGTYYVDIKVDYGMQTRIFKNKLSFKIPSDITRITH